MPMEDQHKVVPSRPQLSRRDLARLELIRLLDEAEADERGGDRGITLEQVRKRLAR